MSCVQDGLIQEGYIAKVADDLYCGGDTPTALLENWRRILTELAHNGLTLSARKTLIAPKTTSILGWQWSEGKLLTFSHQISTLNSCALPDKIKSLHSYLRAYKFLARVIPNSSTYLALLESLVAEKSSSDLIQWSTELEDIF